MVKILITRLVKNNSDISLHKSFLTILWIFQVESATYAQIESFFANTRNGSSQRHLTDVEYVKLIVDSLKMHKNICLCRNFHLLNKKQISSSSTNYFIDVWPVNLFRPETASFFDNTCLFMLQVATSLFMWEVIKKFGTSWHEGCYCWENVLLWVWNANSNTSAA